MKLSILFCLILSLSLQASELSFDQALDIIIQKDTYIPTQKAYIESSRTQRLNSTLNFLPTFEVGYRRNFDFELEKDLKVRSVYLSSNLNLFKGGADISGLLEKKYAVNKYQMGLKRLELEREEKAIRSLVMMILRSKRLKTQKEMVSIKDSALKLAQNRYKKGFTPEDDVLKAQVELKNANATFKDAEISYNDAKKDLAKLIGDYTVKDSWPWTKKLKKISIEKTNRDKLFHPKIEEIKNYLREENSKKNYYLGLMLPRIDFNYSVSRNKILNSRDYERTGLLTLTWTLFDGLSKWSSFKTQSAEKVVAEYTLLREKRNLKEELIATAQNLKMTLDTAKDRDQTLLLSRKLYQRNQLRYRKGKIKIADLEWEQNRLLTSENLAIDGWAKVHLKYCEYCHARGKSVKNCQ